MKTGRRSTCRRSEEPARLRTSWMTCARSLQLSTTSRLCNVDVRLWKVSCLQYAVWSFCYTKVSDKHTRTVPVLGWCAGSFVCSEGMHDFIRVFSILLPPRIYVAGVGGGGEGARKHQIIMLALPLCFSCSAFHYLQDFTMNSALKRWEGVFYS